MTTPDNEQNRLEKSDRYAKLGRLKLWEAQQELNRGDTMQASEKAYGAVSCAAKAYGEKRGWNHYNHHRVGLILEQLQEEWDAPELVVAHLAIREMHNNFFEYELRPIVVQEGLHAAQRIVARLEEMRQSTPRPLPSESLSREQRRRLTLLMQPPKEEQLPVEDLPEVEEPPPDLPPEE